MKKLISVLLCISAICCSAALAGCGNGEGVGSDVIETASQTEAETVSTARLSEVLAADLSESEFDGAVYAVYNGEVVLENDSDTVYRIASVSKQFTAAAVLMLCEQGKMSVDDTLDRYFPEFDKGKDVTIHHLLSMRSGIADYVTLAKDGMMLARTADELDIDINGNHSAKENRETIKAWIFENSSPAPDVYYEYSNSNYFLLGDIIEQVSGISYEEYIQKNIFDPAGMTSTGFGDTWGYADKKLANGKGEGDYEWLTYAGVRFGCGDVMSTAKDLALWAREWLDNQILSDNIVKQMTENYAYEGYGYGIKLDENHKLVYHDGSLPPYSSIMAVAPDKGLIAVALSSDAEQGASSLAMKLMEDCFAS